MQSSLKQSSLPQSTVLWQTSQPSPTGNTLVDSQTSSTSSIVLEPTLIVSPAIQESTPLSSIEPDPSSTGPETIPVTSPVVENTQENTNSLVAHPTAKSRNALTDQQKQEKLKQQAEQQQQKTLIIVVCASVAIIVLSALVNFWYGRRNRCKKSNDELNDLGTDKLSFKGDKLYADRSYQYSRSNRSDYHANQNHSWETMIESTKDNESFSTASTKYHQSDDNDYYNGIQNQFLDSRNAPIYDDGKSSIATPQPYELYQDTPNLNRVDQRTIILPDPAVIDRNSIIMYSPATDFKFMQTPSFHFDSVERNYYEVNEALKEDDDEHVDEKEDYEKYDEHVDEKEDYENDEVAENAEPKRKNSKGLKIAMPSKNVAEKSIIGLKGFNRARLSNGIPSASSRESKVTVHNQIRLSSIPTPSASSIIW